MGNNDFGRSQLLEFEAAQPDNFWRADPHLRRVLMRWEPTRLTTWEDELDAFGAESAGPLDRAVRLNNLPHNLPRLDRWSDFGERVEEVEFHPSYHEAGRYIYGSGVMHVLGEWSNTLRSMTLFYLSAQNGEAGHNCPLACTAGLIKALMAVGSEELKERYLPRLLSTDYEALAHGAQFLTEVQGGSDVGANAVRAVKASGEVAPYRIHGEKWFCSNATADLILMTARPDGAPEGTKGLGLFLVPRRLPDGSLNHYALRRLKEKLGTRSMASAEIDFNGALAWNVGPVEDGFHNVMTWVINSSRLTNAFGTTANARRAYVVAQAYAKTRHAFGQPIGGYPLVQETLADMKAETAAMLSGACYVAHLVDELEARKLDETGQGFLRVALNLNKLRSAISAHEVIASGIEILGGNGAIETFSVMPRLLRDNIVYENWEGTHNVLLMQVYRDCKRKSVHEPFFARLEQQVQRHPRLRDEVKRARARFAEVLGAPEAEASLLMREVGNQLGWLQWAAAMADDGTEPAVLEHFADRRFGPRAARDASYLKRIAALSVMA